ncbi:hypothetical protein SDC9_205754 [bioreactor metagenome]|uniref:Uncharacterized protein n=1 Tax=bioreactor metagenome TaxID=1076179 RepID=A0A645J3N3_9ZZZZ
MRGQVEEDDDKFVTAQAGDRIAFTQGILHPLGDGDQELIAGLMSEAIVDRFEAIEVDIGNPQQEVAALRLPHGLA